jgi:uncharacterized protein YndB with AHSA1/START domain
MITRDLRFTAHITGSPATIFDLVADMPNYGRWLADSSAFGGTTNVTPYPVRLGTTYLDAGPVLKPGSVTEYDRPKHLSFHHTVQLRQSFLNTDVDARIRYTFDPKDGGTFVDRRLDFNHQSPRDVSSGSATSPLRIPKGKQPDTSSPEAIR